MAETSAIEWTDATVNFWWGCSKVGPGCDNCYAETWANRLGMNLWAADAPRRPIKGAAAMLRKLDRGHDRFFAEHGRRRRVFMQSMSDLFDNEVDDYLRRTAFGEAEAANSLDIQFLTKRISNVAKMVPEHWLHGRWPRHVGQMITVVNQDEANRDIPRLLYLDERHGLPWTGLSIEPMLGPIDLTRIVQGDTVYNALTGAVLATVQSSKYSPRSIAMTPRTVKMRGSLRPIGWVIVGGESGHNARPMQADWVRRIRAQCAAAGVPFFFKQWGEYRPTSDANGPYMAWFGRKAAGRELDGRTHDEFWRIAA